MREIAEEIECAARSDAKVLITGESGVGKKVCPYDPRAQPARPCAEASPARTVPPRAGSSRLTWDDLHRRIGEMSLRMQARLLRFLENGEIQRVGSDRDPTRPRVGSSSSRAMTMW